MNILTRFLTIRILKKHAIPYRLWRDVTSHIPLVQLRTNKEKARLRLLSTLFIHKKSFTGAHDLTITLEMAITIASQACIEILYLGLNAFNGWIEIIVYPAAFVVQRETVDENGLVHQQSNNLSGESWGKGPVILSWQDVEKDSYTIHPGHNIIIHEFAHKLDMLSGRANGQPPLPPNMSKEKWAEYLGGAYERLVSQINHHKHTYINNYAATNAAEFFAVCCEYFFTAPQLLEQHSPHVYEQLQTYFRQNPVDLQN